MSLLYLVLLTWVYGQELSRQTQDVNQVSMAIWKSVEIHYSNLSLSNTAFPYYTSSDGKSWIQGQIGGWTSGYLTGIYWQAYNATGNDMYRSLAIQSQLSLIRNLMESKHIGFITHTSFSLSLQMVLYQNVTEDGLKRVSSCAISLSAQYSRTIGCIATDSFDSNSNSSTISTSQEQVTVSIQSVISLETLFQASVITGNQSYYFMAKTHAELTLKYQFRSDGSVYQKVVYDSFTGTVISKSNGDGLSDSSTWARGQAFAIYGYTMVYRYTNDYKFLDAAIRAASYYLSKMPMNQYIPNWDMESSFTNSSMNQSSSVMDSSAAVIVASAFQELASFLSNSDPFKRKLYEFSIQTYLFMYNTQGHLDLSGSYASLVLSGSLSVSQSITRVGLIYSDYYLLEGMNRLKAIRLFDPTYKAGGYYVNPSKSSSPTLSVPILVLFLTFLYVFL